MAKVLLVHNVIPECVKIYLLDVDDTDKCNLIKCHGCIVNSTSHPYEELAGTWLLNYLKNKEPIYSDITNDTIPQMNFHVDFMVYVGFLC